MHRRLRLNLILLAVIGLLAVWIWQAQPPGFQPLTPLDPEQVERIAISDLSGRQTSLRKQQGVWLSGSSLANADRVEQLLGICQTPSLERFVAPDDLSPFGLVPAHIQLQLDGLQLNIGSTDPINGWRYVQIGDQIHLIADGFYHHLTAPPEAWLETPDARTAGG
jgi:hypothetical protein